MLWKIKCIFNSGWRYFFFTLCLSFNTFFFFSLIVTFFLYVFVCLFSSLFALHTFRYLALLPGKFQNNLFIFKIIFKFKPQRAIPPRQYLSYRRRLWSLPGVWGIPKRGSVEKAWAIFPQYCRYTLTLCHIR